MSAEPRPRTSFDACTIERICQWAERRGRKAKEKRVWFVEDEDVCEYAGMSCARVIVADIPAQKLPALMQAIAALIDMYPEVHVLEEEGLPSEVLYLLLPATFVALTTVTLDDLLRMCATVK